MSCGEVREFLLQTDWSSDERRRATSFLQHLAQCQECQKAFKDFDEIRLTLSPAEAPEPEDGWETMQLRVADAIRPPQHNWFRPMLAIAALALLAFGLFEAGRQTGNQSHAGFVINKNKSAATEPFISPTEVTHNVRAFREVLQAYDGHAGWMMMSHNSADVGMISDPVASTKKLLVLRLELWQAERSISSADLLVLAGQSAELTLPMPSGQSLHYRIGTSTDEPVRLSLWLELKTTHGGEPLAALSTDLRLETGQKLAAGKLTTSAGEYELKIDFAGSRLADDKL
jgi:hypothetical protein